MSNLAYDQFADRADQAEKSLEALQTRLSALETAKNTQSNDKFHSIVAKLRTIRDEAITLEKKNEELTRSLQIRDQLSLDSRRSLHWVLRIGNLKRSMDFYEQVFGMKVLRHEEFKEGCEANCNGEYSRPWSKTMVGYGFEMNHFALELTYNYGIKAYERGNDLKYLGLCITAAGLECAQKMGYQCDKYVNIDDGTPTYDWLITGPDMISYAVRVVESLPSEPFIGVGLNVRNIAHTFKYWVGTLGMHARSKVDNKFLSAAYGNTVPLHFYQLPAETSLNHAKAEGRIAFTTSIDKGPFVIHDSIAEKKEYTVLNAPVTLPTPGKADVEVVILADVDGYEICFVGEEGFRDLCTTKPGDEKIEWEQRAEMGADKDKGRFIK